MKHKSIHWMVLLMALAGCWLLAGCRQQRLVARDQHKVEAVSETAPPLEPPHTPVTLLARAKQAPSQGTCAPRYANGLMGTCINGQACRGLGVLDAGGHAACACFAKAGGCSEGERCDAIKKACVPENQPPFGRPPGK